MLKKDEVVAEMKQKLDEISTEIDALDVKARAVKEDMKVKYQEQLLTLRAQREEGEKMLENMRSATENSWESVKAETNNIWVALEDSVNAFKMHFK